MLLLTVADECYVSRFPRLIKGRTLSARNQIPCTGTQNINYVLNRVHYGRNKLFGGPSCRTQIISTFNLAPSYVSLPITNVIRGLVIKLPEPGIPTVKLLSYLIYTGKSSLPLIESILTYFPLPNPDLCGQCL